MNEIIVEATGLCRDFGKTKVLQGLDLSIQRGMVVGLLGTNGSGKSTLIKCLLGLLRVSGGTARLFGEDGRVIWIVAMFAVTAIAGAYFCLQDALPAEGSLSLQIPLTLVLSIFVPDLPVIAMVGFWRGRRKLLAVESLRAVSRNQFSAQIARALAWDLFPLFGVYLAVLTWYSVEADSQLWSWGWLASMLLVFVARWIIVYGLTLWAIVIRRDWVVMLVAFVTGYVLLFVNVALIFLQGPVLGVKQLSTDTPQIGVLALAAMALGYAMVGCAVTHFAYRRWQTVELV